MQAKTTRAFRTISEAGEELDLQPHVLRFWESKFSQIKPIKRGGGRRFYRPEDIEFLRGIKILLHDEGHPIKDVQKLIRLKGPGRVLELGQSVQKAARQKKVEDTVLVPERIQKYTLSEGVKANVSKQSDNPPQERVGDKPSVEEQTQQPARPTTPPAFDATTRQEVTPSAGIPNLSEAEISQRRGDLQDALSRLQALKNRWASFLPDES